MPQASKPYASARTGVLQSRLINEDKLKRMLEAPDYESVKRALAEAGYPDVDTENYEQVISSGMEEACRYVREVSPNEYATNVFLLKYDCNNVKSLLKAKLLGKQAIELSGMGTVDAEQVRAVVDSDEYYRMPKHMAAACEEIVKSIDSGTADAQRIDLVMDKACYADMEHYAHKSKDKTVLECVRAMADLLNLRTLLRIRKVGGKADAVQAAVVPGGHIDTKAFVDAVGIADEALYKQLRMDRYAKAVASGLEEYIHGGSLSALERASDDYITGMLRERKYDMFSISPLISYIIAKEREAQAVRLLMVSKLNDVPHKLVMERLRELL